MWPGSVYSGGTWHVAQRALPSKRALPRTKARASKDPAGGARCGDRELIKVQRRELRRDLVGRAARIPRTRPGGHGELGRILEPGVDVDPRAMHLGYGDERIPVGHRTEPRPRVQVDAGQSEGRRYQRARLLAVRAKGLAVLVEFGVEAPWAPTLEHLLAEVHPRGLGSGEEGADIVRYVGWPFALRTPRSRWR